MRKLALKPVIYRIISNNLFGCDFIFHKNNKGRIVNPSPVPFLQDGRLE